ncbi:hypothetical protein VPNG_01173 [Cytospora leucostoma]|uniref:Uncharacterized protein n=1 Tax=Cytospora leucostoma TaxID=1230097 RepID=A0A423XKM6_9PEZI|nr:hypothetical protein VPNG_01173 [Cytospora leucostoma]
MDEPAEPSSQDGDPSTTTPPSPSDLPEVITIAPRGDVLLELTFETSKSTLKATRKALPRPRPGQRDPPPPQPLLRARVHLAYRVDLATLKRHSKYFTNLLGDTRFREARAVESHLADLSLRGEDPGDLGPGRLPRVRITDDDEATRSAGREDVFRDMLRVLHGGGVAVATARPVTLLYVATLAVMADRFACAAAVSRYLNTGLKFKWPATPLPRPSGEGDGLVGLSPAAEEVLRQKILVSWLLDQPVRFQAATRELVLFGSHRWSADGGDEDEDEGDDVDGSRTPADDATASRQEALWWYLPDELEEELHYRRALVLRTLASITSHFVRLYSSRARQCHLGYDSSAACDSFQLGEMVRFLAGRGLLFLVDFSPSSPRAVRDFAAVDVGGITAALKKMPAYQIDKHHTNCGLRTRVLPILEYVQAMLGSNAVPLSLQGWKRDRVGTSWRTAPSAAEDGGSGGVRRRREFDTGKASRIKVFSFTRSLASDQRLKYEGAMAADSMAKQLFLAEDWDWTPEDDSGSGNSLGREFATTKWLK